MSIKAVLKIDGKKFNLLQANYNFLRPADPTGYVNGMVRLGRIELLLPLMGDTFFLHWMFKPDMQKAGSISYFDEEDMVRKVKKVSFAGSFCVGFKEVHHAISRLPMYTEVVLSAGGMKIEESEYRSPWFKGPFKTEIEEVVEEVVEFIMPPTKETVTARGGEVKMKSLVAKPELINKDPMGSALIDSPVKPLVPRRTDLSLDEFLRSFTKTPEDLDQVEAQKALDTYLDAETAFNNGDKSLCIERSKDLETLFNNNKWNISKDGVCWPPMNGGFNTTRKAIKAGDKFDRFQKNVYFKKGNPPNIGDLIDTSKIINGNYLSPILDNPFSYADRALVGEENEYSLEYEIKFLKDVEFTQEESDIIPWHGHEGLGVQTKFAISGAPENWKEMYDTGIFTIQVKSSPNGKFEILPDGMLKIIKL